MITVGLVGGGDPPDVQIVIDSVADGAAWRVTGTAGDWSWTVPGGEGVGDGGQVVLLDNRAPGNVEVVYQVEVGGVVDSAVPVTVPMSSGMVIQTLDGSLAVPCELLVPSGDVTRRSRQALFDVAGRTNPVVRRDRSGGIEGTLSIEVKMSQTERLYALLDEGEPLVYRLGSNAKDVRPVAVFAYGDVSSEALPHTWDGLRFWDIPYRIVDDPILDLRFGSPAWDAVNALLADLTWDDFDARFGGVSWDELDRLDWDNF